MEIQCPKCGSENVQKASLAYEAGATKSKSTTIFNGIGVASGGFGVGTGIGSTTATHRTVISMRAKPPTKMPEDYNAQSQVASSGFLRPVAVIVGLIGLGAALERNIFGAILGLCSAPAIWIYYVKAIPAAKRRLAHIAKYNGEIFPRELALWQRSWFCSKCGHIGPIPPDQ